MPGQNNHGSHRRYDFDPGQDFSSIDIRQVKIQQNEEEIFLLNQVERLLSVVANVAITAPQAQALGQHVGKALFVIDD
jgi:hypothetical protein